MIFRPTKITGAFIVEIEKKEDDRGFFARTYDSEIFKENNLNPTILHCNVNYTKKKGTLKGLHYQAKPFEETKLIRCTKGSVYSVTVDLRPESPTFKQWESFILSDKDYFWRYIPEGCANGIQTLDDNTEIIYQNSQVYSKKDERGVRWNDPVFNIDWPLSITDMSEKDKSWKDFTP